MNNNYITPEEIDIAVEGLFSKIKDKIKGKKQSQKTLTPEIKKFSDEYFKSVSTNKSKISAIIENIIKKNKINSDKKYHIDILPDLSSNASFIDNGEVYITLIHINLQDHEGYGSDDAEAIVGPAYKEIKNLFKDIEEKASEISSIINCNISISDYDTGDDILGLYMTCKIPSE